MFEEIENDKQLKEFYKDNDLIEETGSNSALSGGLWRKPEAPPEDNREVVLLTKFDVYLARYIDGEWNLPTRYDEQWGEEILGWIDKP